MTTPAPDRWSDAQLEELKRELQAKHLLDPIYRRCADAIGSLQFDLVDARRALATPAQSPPPAESKEATHRRFYEAFHAWFKQGHIVDFWSEADAPEELATIAVEIYDRRETAQSEGK